MVMDGMRMIFLEGGEDSSNNRGKLGGIRNILTNLQCFGPDLAAKVCKMRKVCKWRKWQRVQEYKGASVLVYLNMRKKRGFCQAEGRQTVG